jgi:hypothetical protein
MMLALPCPLRFTFRREVALVAALVGQFTLLAPHAKAQAAPAASASRTQKESAAVRHAATIGKAPHDPMYGPLWLYKGTWDATRTAPTPKRDVIANDCSRVGRYFICQQTVNDTMSGLIIFLPRAKRGLYVTQGVNAEGFALGRGTLVIDGDHWTYGSVDRSNDSTTYYRTTNVFTGKDRIHFESSQSRDSVTWTAGTAGDEVRRARPR